jgi:ABC-type oligopeptide transport system substrate-binding subunit
MSHFDAEALVAAKIDAAASRTGQLSRRTLLKHGAALSAGVAGFSAFQHSVAGMASNRLRAANILAQNSELAADQVVRLPEGEPIRFDPGVTSGGRGLEMLQNLFEGLVLIDQRDGSLQMGLAEKMDVNDEQTEFTFAVRDGVTWSDGTPLNASDFEWSWKRVLDPATKSEYTTALYPLKNAAAIDAGDMDLAELGVKATDEKTLVVTLEGPTPYFPLLAATWTYYPVPRHVVEAEGDAWVEAGKMVSNGPYVLTGWEHDQSMTLERNEKYYGEAPVIRRWLPSRIMSLTRHRSPVPTWSGSRAIRILAPRFRSSHAPGLHSSSATRPIRQPTTCACVRQFLSPSSGTCWPTAC